MIGKIVYLDNNEQYYIMDELKYNNKLYVFGGQYIKDKEDIDYETLYAFEAKLINNEIILGDIDDDKIAIEVSKKFLERLHNNK